MDAVVHLPVGAYPGEMQGRYASDMAHIIEVIGATMRGFIPQHPEKWAYGAAGHAEMTDKLVGYKRVRESPRARRSRRGMGLDEPDEN